MNPKVDVIIPAYNSEKYIRKCLDSLLDQTYQDWTAFIIISPSTDNTKEICQEYYSRFPERFVLYYEYRKTNCATARNKGISIGCGTYIAFLDSDDWWHKEKLNKIVECFESGGYDVGWVGSYLQFEYPDKEPWILKHAGPDISLVAHSVFRRSLLMRIKKRDGYIFYWKMSRADDMDLAMRLRNEYMVMIPEPLSYYRQVQEGLTLSQSSLEGQRQVIEMAIRNSDINLPHYLLNYLITKLNVLTGGDIVALKKRIIG